MRDRLYILQHVPKTGGTFIFARLAELKPVQRFPHQEAKRRRELLGPVVKHWLDNWTEHIIGHHFFYGVHEYLGVPRERAFYYFFLRDPVERTVSLFNYYKREEHHKKHGLYLEMGIVSYTEMLRGSPRANNFMTRYLASAFEGSGTPRIENCKPNQIPVTQAELDSAKRYVDAVDFCGFMDRFEEDCRRVFKIMGLTFPEGRPRLNQSGTEFYQPTESELEETRERHGLDYELYKHAKEVWQ